MTSQDIPPLPSSQEYPGLGELLYEAVKSYNEAIESFTILKNNYLLKIRDLEEHI